MSYDDFQSFKKKLGTDPFEGRKIDPKEALSQISNFRAHIPKMTEWSKLRLAGKDKAGYITRTFGKLTELCDNILKDDCSSVKPDELKNFAYLLANLINRWYEDDNPAGARVWIERGYWINSPYLFLTPKTAFAAYQLAEQMEQW